MQYFYTYWSNNPKAMMDFRSSPIFSIATLRAHTSDPIWVIDYSESDWEDYDNKLNIRIIKKKPFFEHSFFSHLNDFQVKTLSRNFDVIHESYFSEFDEVVISDADMFWLDCVKENWNNGCNFREKNNGCYLYRKSDNLAMQFLDMVKYFCVKGMQSKETMEEIKSICGYFNDEAVFSYVRKMRPDLCEGGFFPYNGPIKDLADSGSIGFYKNVHLIAGYLMPEHRNIRCLFPLLVTEFRELIEKTLPNENFLQCSVYDLEKLLASGMTGVSRAISSFSEKLFL